MRSSADASSESVKKLYTPLYRNYALGLLFLGYVVNFIDRSILSILLEPIKTCEV
jgi:hypothetical protein